MVRFAGAAVGVVLTSGLCACATTVPPASQRTVIPTFNHQIPEGDSMMAGARSPTSGRCSPLPPRDAILPDCLIGAHASAAGLAVPTRDPGRIRTAVPGVSVIEPTLSG